MIILFANYSKNGRIKNQGEIDISSFKSFSQKFNHLNLDDLIKFYLVFEGHNINSNYNDIFIAIKDEILINYKNILFKFDFDKNSKLALIKFAKNDRKRFSINKIMPRFQGQKTVNTLLENGFLELEKSREKKPTPKRKNEKLPKCLRRYIVHDKVKFKNHFDRFWFRFIEPNLVLLQENKIDELLEIIKKDFDNYLSLGFEALSSELLQKYLNLKSDIYSFWNKDIEIDIFCEYDDFLIVGEVKYKERKVCKNVLNMLNLKCQKIGAIPDKVVIFSKSGFSNEILNLKDENILLFSLNDYEILLK